MMFWRGGRSTTLTFLFEQSVADATQGFCIPPVDRARFLKEIQNQPHRLITHCVTTQSSGKQRVIDNADTGGLRPAQHIAMVAAGWSGEAIEEFFQTDAWERTYPRLTSLRIESFFL